MLKKDINNAKKYGHIIDVYKSQKSYDVPDTFIVRCIFPKHGIFIGYDRWMQIKKQFVK